jgi:hypothetical protein
MYREATRLHVTRHCFTCIYKSSDVTAEVVSSTSQWPNIEKLPSRSHEPSSEKAFETLNRWISECFQDHKVCSKRTVSNLPKRVLEIRDYHVYLKSLPGLQAKYACLSHRWGKQGASLKLTSATFETLNSGILTEDLPKTFADAAKINRRLGIRYIWIDAVCMSSLQKGIKAQYDLMYDQACYKTILKIGKRLLRQWQAYTRMLSLLLQHHGPVIATVDASQPQEIPIKIINSAILIYLSDGTCLCFLGMLANIRNVTPMGTGHFSQEVGWEIPRDYSI